MKNINKNEDTLVQSTLSELTESLLVNMMKERNSLLISIHEMQTNIDILQRKIKMYYMDQGDSSDIFKVNYGRTHKECKIMENTLKDEQKKIEEMQKDYNKAIVKEQNISRLNTHLKDDQVCNLKKMDGEISEDVNGLKLLEIQEIERKRIARELHDSTVQNLTNLVHKTELCTKLVDLDPIRAKLELQTMIGTIKTTINDMRNIIYDLRPMSLEDLGLVITVKRYIKQFIDSTKIKVVLNVENERKINSDIIDLTLFRIIQEGCNNAMKHAKATVIYINLNYNKNNIELVIEDNGCGFEQNICKEDQYVLSNSLSGFGLPMMKERVGLLSGQIEIVSAINKGTKIRVCVPIN